MNHILYGGAAATECISYVIHNKLIPHKYTLALNNASAKRGTQWTEMGEFQRLDTPGSILSEAARIGTEIRPLRQHLRAGWFKGSARRHVLTGRGWCPG